MGLYRYGYSSFSYSKKTGLELVLTEKEVSMLSHYFSHYLLAKYGRNKDKQIWCNKDLICFLVVYLPKLKFLKFVSSNTLKFRLQRSFRSELFKKFINNFKRTKTSDFLNTPRQFFSLGAIYTSDYSLRFPG